MRRVLLVLAACNGGSNRSSGPPPSPSTVASPAPTASTAAPVGKPRSSCIGADRVELTVDAGRAVLCWRDGCLRYELDTPPTAIARPPRGMFRAEAEVREVHGRQAACNAEGCTPLGDKLAKHIAKILTFQQAQAPGDGRDGRLMPQVTRDRALVYLSGTNLEPRLWSVADDGAIRAEPPASFRRFAEAHVVAGQPVGLAMLLMWSACRTLDALGGCGMDAVYRSSLVDSRGRDLDGDHEDFTYVMQAAPERFVTVGDTVQVVERGKVVASRAFTDASRFSSPTPQVVVLDHDHVALLFHGTAGWRLLMVALTKGLPSVELARPAECSL